MSARAVARGVGHTIKWIVISAFALIVIIVVVALVSLGKASSNADKQSSRVAAHIQQVHLGASKAQVRAILGKPDSTQRMVTSGLVDDTWYYGTLSAKGSWQFVFVNGRLTAKNRY